MIRPVLLVHDVVNAFVERGDADLGSVIVNIRALPEAARAAAMPIVFAVPGPRSTLTVPPLAQG
jgi:nicotinamidase-related amidase